MDFCTQLHLYAAGLALYAVFGIQDLELAGPAAISVTGGEVHAGDVVPLHPDDPRPLGHSAGVSKGNRGVAVHPGFAGHGEDLLEIFVTVHGDRVGGIPVRLHRQPGLQDVVPVHSGLVDLLRGVVPLVHIVEPQLIQGAVGVAAGHDAEHFRVRIFLVSEVRDPRSRRNRLRHTGGVRIHAVGGHLPGGPVRIHEIVIGVGLLPHSAVDGQIGHLLAVVEDLDLPQGLLHAGGGKGRAWEHPQDHDQRQKQSCQLSFHKIPPKCEERVPARHTLQVLMNVQFSEDFVLSSLENAIRVDVPDLQVPVPAGAGVQGLRDHLRLPGPETGDRFTLRHGQLDVEPGGSVAAADGLPVLPGGGVGPHGVVQGVQHPAGLVEVADEEVVHALHVEVPGLGFGQLRLVELGPVAGGGGQLAHRAAGEVVFVIPAHVRDGVAGAVVTEDDVARLGGVPGTVLRDGYTAV